MRRISFLIVLALAAVSLSAQNRQNQPTFRSGAAYVRVDMTSTPANARTPFRIRTSTWVRNSAEDARQGAFWVVGELDYQTRRQLAWTAGAQAEVVVLDSSGKEIMTRTVDLKPEDGPFGIQVPETGAIAAGEYAVSVRLRSQADEKAELTDTARVVLREGPSLGEAVMPQMLALEPCESFEQA